MFVLITRRSKLYYTASGIITPVGGRPVRRLRAELNLVQMLIVFPLLHTQTVNFPTLYLTSGLPFPEGRAGISWEH